jgi:hypothetical protein
MTPSERLEKLKRWWSPEPALVASADARTQAARLASLGRENLLAARTACDERLAAVATELYAKAIESFARAQDVGGSAAGAEPSGTPPRAASSLVEASPGAASEAKADAVRLLDDPKGAGDLAAGRRRRAIALLDRVSAGLDVATYPASDAEVTRVRFARRVVTGVVVAALVGLAGEWVTSPHNVARGKPVTASSIRFGAPQALVNGAIEWGSFGLHTGGSGREWATIDLERFYSLDYAEIYSRGDGRFEFNLPLRVELSDDGSNFRPGGACTDLFTQATPCVVDLHRQRARYVRVTAPEVVLAEVEVYARP